MLVCGVQYATPDTTSALATNDACLMRHSDMLRLSPLRWQLMTHVRGNVQTCYAHITSALAVSEAYQYAAFGYVTSVFMSALAANEACQHVAPEHVTPVFISAYICKTSK